MSHLYVGLISGTSADGIDAALVDFSQPQPKFIGGHYTAFDDELQQTILELNQPGFNEINRLGDLDVLLGKEFAYAVNSLLKKHDVTAKEVRAIGSHGQTVRHHPTRQFTLQIADPNIIAAETGITTVADFRRRDMAHGGQGAPLVPALHHTLLATSKNDRVVVNIGGVANITFLPADTTLQVIGFDTGPGNNLQNAWMQKHHQQPYDKNGEWAASGKVNTVLLKSLLNDPYFFMPSPKSTGPEYFNLGWLEKYLSRSIKPVDVQATLVELTAQTIIDSIKKHCSSGEILICGGGVHNKQLMNRLTVLAKPFSVQSTTAFGIDPDWVEAIAFAWLAKQTLEKKPGNIMTVTGARQPAVLGGVYFS